MNLLYKINTVLKAGQARLFKSVSHSETIGFESARFRMLFIVNAYIPTLQLSFIKPLASLIESNEVSIEILSEQQMKELFGKRLNDPKVVNWIDQRIKNFQPDIIVFCRYSGPHSEYVVKEAKKRDCPTIFHIDDDLLNVPVEIGQKKYEFHNQSRRLATIKYLLNNVDLIYCSTENLKSRFESNGVQSALVSGKIYSSADVLVPAERRNVSKIGYMGFDHANDFKLALPGLIGILRKYPDINFELFGSIPKPDELDEFGKRIKVIPPERDYKTFMEKFSERKWDIGLCPLTDTAFNGVKANTKWVEYSAVGAAVIASADTIYDDCCSNNCGILASGVNDWFKSLEMLISDKNLRYSLVLNAQNKLSKDYSVEGLRKQVIDTLAHCYEIVGKKHVLFNDEKIN